MSENYKKGGLETDRYIIQKKNGEPVDPNAWYFVLRIDKDPHARIAALAYSRSVEQDNPKFAKELQIIVGRFEEMALTASTKAAQPQKGTNDDQMAT